MQKFKHNNANIWIWKFYLLKIYLNYRELMITGWLTVEGWLKLKEENYKRKFFELSIFLHSLNFFFLLLKLSSQLCLMKKFEALFIGEAPDFKRTLSLQFWKILNPLPCVWSMRFVQKVNSSCLLSFFSFFITLHLSH